MKFHKPRHTMTDEEIDRALLAIRHAAARRQNWRKELLDLLRSMKPNRQIDEPMLARIITKLRRRHDDLS